MLIREMLIRKIVYGFIACLGFILYPTLGMTGDNANGTALKTSVAQPYIVKKNDTLWDIADHFFKNPQRWMSIWDRNLYITNPDLIYPGNKIWFDAAHVPKQLAQEPRHSSFNGTDTAASKMNHERLMTPREVKTLGGLTTVRPRPSIIVKEVERLESNIEQTFEFPEMLRRDFIDPKKSFVSIGYILDSEMHRLNYGEGDQLYLRFSRAVLRGEQFDVFRKGHAVADIQNGGELGTLMHHLGKIEVVDIKGGVYKGRVLYAFSEISRGDMLVPNIKIETKISSSVSLYNMQGRVVYLQDDTTEVSSSQIVAINLGKKQGLRPGMKFVIFHAGRIIEDVVTGHDVQLPMERIGRIMIISVTPNSAMAFVTEAVSPIHMGDHVRPATH
ncbi:MAG: LysM peptidoglycan-binding domain-containing protein [Mariprofundaceae bacterium]|nr:LysM peptidoglycan-binding domain-containing protein [Mariprofundaceae bacterium]